MPTESRYADSLTQSALQNVLTFRSRLKELTNKLDINNELQQNFVRSFEQGQRNVTNRSRPRLVIISARRPHKAHQWPVMHLKTNHPTKYQKHSRCSSRWQKIQTRSELTTWRRHQGPSSWSWLSLDISKSSKKGGRTGGEGGKSARAQHWDCLEIDRRVFVFSVF